MNQLHRMSIEVVKTAQPAHVFLPQNPGFFAMREDSPFLFVCFFHHGVDQKHSKKGAYGCEKPPGARPGAFPALVPYHLASVFFPLFQPGLASLYLPQMDGHTVNGLVPSSTSFLPVIANA